MLLRSACRAGRRWPLLALLGLATGLEQVRYECIPQELRERPAWVVWKRERDAGGKPIKPPYRVDHKGKASPTDPSTWAAFDQAVAVAENGYDGIGIALSADDPFTLIDLDGVVGETGVDRIGGSVVKTLASYSERSQSGTGLHVIVRAELNGARNRTSHTPWAGGIEIYDRARFAYLTGDVLGDEPLPIMARQKQLDEVRALFWPPVQEPKQAEASAPVDDHQLLDRAFNARNGSKVEGLYRGDTAGYPSDSEADCALCRYLAFWTGADSDRLDRLFRGSGLMREKWERADYRDKTIGKALEGMTRFYDWTKATVANSGSVAESGTDGEPVGRTVSSGDTGFSPAPERMREQAFHGPAGTIVRKIEPHSEADPAAILVQLLVAFGNACGRGPGFRVESDEHGTNEFVGIVGRTVSARKGTSWGHIRNRIMFQVDTDWAARCMASGIASGEGLIHHVRDQRIEKRRARTNEEKAQADADGRIEEEVDPGVDDKRLLVIESELASVLRVMAREGNTVSPTLRALWDHGDAQSLAKNSPDRTTGSLVTLIGHITVPELREGLAEVEAANGFGNRWLWVWAARSKRLPHGGDLDSVDLGPEIVQLRKALNLARGRGMLGFTDEARKVWAAFYTSLDDERDDLLGAVTARAAPHVRRLAVIYALLDQHHWVGVDHLQAAIAVWDYCEASAAHIFGGKVGYPLADKILAAIREAGVIGLTRTAIRELVGGHVPAEQIDKAMRFLHMRGVIDDHVESTTPKGGRRPHRYTLATRSEPRGRSEQTEVSSGADEVPSGSEFPACSCPSHPAGPAPGCRYCRTQGAAR